MEAAIEAAKVETQAAIEKRMSTAEENKNVQLEVVSSSMSSIVNNSPYLSLVLGDADRPEGPQCSDKERQNQHGGSDETQGPVHHREHC